MLVGDSACDLRDAPRKKPVIADISCSLRLAYSRSIVLAERMQFRCIGPRRAQSAVLGAIHSVSPQCEMRHEARASSLRRMP
jgi:hypothetical protein